MSADLTLCTEFVMHGYDGRGCGKPAKGTGENGKPLCGIHLAAERRRSETDAKHQAKWDGDKAFRTEVSGFAKAHALGSLAEWDVETRRVSLSFEELAKLVERAER
ncbi:MAG: hypothetical protein PHX83_06650 [Acidobacteriia bacterium]|nr:hypothetical protein [Terriglobia bacterium]